MSPARRVLGLGAAAAVAASSVVLTGGVAAAAPLEPYTFSHTWTGPYGLVFVPEAGYCRVEWVVVGAQGGADADGNPGARGGEIRVTTDVEAGMDYFLQVGEQGASHADGSAGGRITNVQSGEDGDLQGLGGGGGGGATVVMGSDGEDIVAALGGRGAGADGGAGGDGHEGSTPPHGANYVAAPYTPTSTGVTTRTGHGLISGTVLPCDSTPVLPTPPAAPELTSALASPGTVNVRFTPVPAADGRAAATGYEVSLDGGATWAPVQARLGSAGATATLTGVPAGQYRVTVRATSAAGPGAASRVVPVTVPQVVGVPTDVRVTAGVASITVTWAPPATGTPVGGYVAESYDAAEEVNGTPIAMCQTDVAGRSCVLPAVPGHRYRVTVMAGGGASTVVGPSGVVAAPAVPATVPTASGPLGAPAGPSVTAGRAVTLTGSGYLPDSTVTLVVYSTPTVLGTVVTDGNGAFSTTVTLPSGLASGAHTLVASGVDPAGNPRALALPVTVAATGAAAGGGSAGSGGLAYTGADVAVPAVGGVAALLLGGGLVVAARRRSA
ncbi:hypothetical protein [Geodermatophilus sp. SYSU D01119]